MRGNAVAYLEDYNPDNERRLALESSGPGENYSGSADGSQPQTSSAQQQGTGYLPLTSYFTANEDAGKGMATGLADDVREKGKEAVQAWDQNKATDANNRVGLLGTQEGIAQGLQGKYSDPLYSSGMGGLDAYLATRGSTGAFDDLRKQFGSLDWNKIGTPRPETPTQRDVGLEPQLMGVEETDSFGNKSYDVPDVWNHGRYNQYKDSKPAYDAWQQSNAQAQAEYDAATKDYQSKMGEWSGMARPFYDTFGVQMPDATAVKPYEANYNPWNDIIPGHRDKRLGPDTAYEGGRFAP